MPREYKMNDFDPNTGEFQVNEQIINNVDKKDLDEIINNLISKVSEQQQKQQQSIGEQIKDQFGSLLNVIGDQVSQQQKEISESIKKQVDEILKNISGSNVQKEQSESQKQIEETNKTLSQSIGEQQEEINNIKEPIYSMQKTQKESQQQEKEYFKKSLHLWSKITGQFREIDQQLEQIPIIGQIYGLIKSQVFEIVDIFKQVWTIGRNIIRFIQPFLNIMKTIFTKIYKLMSPVFELISKSFRFIWKYIFGSSWFNYFLRIGYNFIRISFVYFLEALKYIIKRMQLQTWKTLSFIQKILGFIFQKPLQWIGGLFGPLLSKIFGGQGLIGRFFLKIFGPEGWMGKLFKTVFGREGWMGKLFSKVFGKEGLFGRILQSKKVESLFGGLFKRGSEKQQEKQQEGVGKLGTQQQKQSQATSKFNLGQWFSSLQKGLTQLTPQIPVILTLTQQIVGLGVQIRLQQPVLIKFLDVVQNVILAVIGQVRDTLRDMIDLQKEGPEQVKGFLQLSGGMLQMGTGLLQFSTGLTILQGQLQLFKGLRKIGLIDEDFGQGTIKGILLGIFSQFDFGFTEEDRRRIEQNLQLQVTQLKQTNQQVQTMVKLSLWKIFNSIQSIFGGGFVKQFSTFKESIIVMFLSLNQLENRLQNVQINKEYLIDILNFQKEQFVQIGDQLGQLLKKFKVGFFQGLQQGILGLFGQDPLSRFKRSIDQYQQQTNLLFGKNSQFVQINVQEYDQSQIENKINIVSEQISMVQSQLESITEHFKLGFFEQLGEQFLSLFGISQLNRFNKGIESFQKQQETIFNPDSQIQQVPIDKTIQDETIQKISLTSKQLNLIMDVLEKINIKFKRRPIDLIGYFFMKLFGKTPLQEFETGVKQFVKYQQMIFGKDSIFRNQFFKKEDMQEIVDKIKITQEQLSQISDIMYDIQQKYKLGFFEQLQEFFETIIGENQYQRFRRQFNTYIDSIEKLYGENGVQSKLSLSTEKLKEINEKIKISSDQLLLIQNTMKEIGEKFNIGFWQGIQEQILRQFGEDQFSRFKKQVDTYIDQVNKIFGQQSPLNFISVKDEDVKQYQTKIQVQNNQILQIQNTMSSVEKTFNLGFWEQIQEQVKKQLGVDQLTRFNEQVSQYRNQLNTIFGQESPIITLPDEKWNEKEILNKINQSLEQINQVQTGMKQQFEQFDMGLWQSIKLQIQKQFGVDKITLFNEQMNSFRNQIDQIFGKDSQLYNISIDEKSLEQNKIRIEQQLQQIYNVSEGMKKQFNTFDMGIWQSIKLQVQKQFGVDKITLFNEQMNSFKNQIDQIFGKDSQLYNIGVDEESLKQNKIRIEQQLQQIYTVQTGMKQQFDTFDIGIWQQIKQQVLRQFGFDKVTQFNTQIETFKNQVNSLFGKEGIINTIQLDNKELQDQQNKVKIMLDTVTNVQKEMKQQFNGFDRSFLEGLSQQILSIFKQDQISLFEKQLSEFEKQQNKLFGKESIINKLSLSKQDFQESQDKIDIVLQTIKSVQNTMGQQLNNFDRSFLKGLSQQFLSIFKQDEISLFENQLKEFEKQQNKLFGKYSVVNQLSLSKEEFQDTQSKINIITQTIQTVQDTMKKQFDNFDKTILQVLSQQILSIFKQDQISLFEKQLSEFEKQQNRLFGKESIINQLSLNKQELQESQDKINTILQTIESVQSGMKQQFDNFNQTLFESLSQQILGIFKQDQISKFKQQLTEFEKSQNLLFGKQGVISNLSLDTQQLNDQSNKINTILNTIQNVQSGMKDSFQNFNQTLLEGLSQQILSLFKQDQISKFKQQLSEFEKSQNLLFGKQGVINNISLDTQQLNDQSNKINTILNTIQNVQTGMKNSFQNFNQSLLESLSQQILKLFQQDQVSKFENQLKEFEKQQYKIFGQNGIINEISLDNEQLKQSSEKINTILIVIQNIQSGMKQQFDNFDTSLWNGIQTQILKIFKQDEVSKFEKQLKEFEQQQNTIFGQNGVVQTLSVNIENFNDKVKLVETIIDSIQTVQSGMKKQFENFNVSLWSGIQTQILSIFKQDEVSKFKKQLKEFEQQQKELFGKEGFIQSLNINEEELNVSTKIITSILSTINKVQTGMKEQFDKFDKGFLGNIQDQILKIFGQDQVTNFKNQVKVFENTTKELFGQNSIFTGLNGIDFTQQETVKSNINTQIEQISTIVNQMKNVKDTFKEEGIFGQIGDQIQKVFKVDYISKFKDQISQFISQQQTIFSENSQLKSFSQKDQEIIQENISMQSDQIENITGQMNQIKDTFQEGLFETIGQQILKIFGQDQINNFKTGIKNFIDQQNYIFSSSGLNKLNLDQNVQKTISDNIQSQSNLIKQVVDQTNLITSNFKEGIFSQIGDFILGIFKQTELDNFKKQINTFVLQTNDVLSKDSQFYKLVIDQNVINTIKNNISQQESSLIQVIDQVKKVTDSINENFKVNPFIQIGEEMQSWFGWDQISRFKQGLEQFKDQINTIFGNDNILQQLKIDQQTNQQIITNIQMQRIQLEDVVKSIKVIYDQFGKGTSIFSVLGSWLQDLLGKTPMEKFKQGLQDFVSQFDLVYGENSIIRSIQPNQEETKQLLYKLDSLRNYLYQQTQQQNTIYNQFEDQVSGNIFVVLGRKLQEALGQTPLNQFKKGLDQVIQQWKYLTSQDTGLITLTLSEQDLNTIINNLNLVKDSIGQIVDTVNTIKEQFSKENKNIFQIIGDQLKNLFTGDPFKNFQEGLKQITQQQQTLFGGNITSLKLDSQIIETTIKQVLSLKSITDQMENLDFNSMQKSIQKQSQLKDQDLTQFQNKISSIKTNIIDQITQTLSNNNQILQMQDKIEQFTNMYTQLFNSLQNIEKIESLLTFTKKVDTNKLNQYSQQLQQYFQTIIDTFQKVNLGKPEAINEISSILNNINNIFSKQTEIGNKNMFQQLDNFTKYIIKFQDQLKYLEGVNQDNINKVIQQMNNLTQPQIEGVNNQQNNYLQQIQNEKPKPTVTIQTSVNTQSEEQKLNLMQSLNNSIQSMGRDISSIRQLLEEFLTNQKQQNINVQFQGQGLGEIIQTPQTNETQYHVQQQSQNYQKGK